MSTTSNSTQPYYVAILKKGWLLKRGHVVKSWKLRFFVLLSDGTLYYYTRPPVEMIMPNSPSNNNNNNNNSLLSWFSISGLSIPLLSSTSKDDGYGIVRKGSVKIDHTCKVKELDPNHSSSSSSSTTSPEMSSALNEISKLGGYPFYFSSKFSSNPNNFMEYYLIANDFFTARSWLGCFIKCGASLDENGIIERDLSSISSTSTEYLYERQRFYPIRGWTDTLLPHDPFNWSSDIEGKIELYPEQITLPDSEWKWVDPAWVVTSPPSLPANARQKFNQELGRTPVNKVPRGKDTLLAVPIHATQNEELGWEYSLGFLLQFELYPAHFWSSQVRRRRWARSKRINEMRVVEARFDIIELMLTKLELKLEYTLGPSSRSNSNSKSNNSINNNSNNNSNNSSKSSGAKPKGFHMDRESPYHLSTVQQEMTKLRGFMTDLIGLFTPSTALLTEDQHLAAKERLASLRKRVDVVESQLLNYTERKNAFTTAAITALHDKHHGSGSSGMIYSTKSGNSSRNNNNSNNNINNINNINMNNNDSTSGKNANIEISAFSSSTNNIEKDSFIEPISYSRAWGKPQPKIEYSPDMETEETRSLSSKQLLELQTKIINEQDKGLDLLLSVLKRQKNIAVKIGDEVDRQNVMLNDLSNAMDKTSGTLEECITQAESL